MDNIKKVSLVVLLLGPILLVVIAIFLFTSNKSSENTEEENQEETVTVEEAILTFSSLKDAVSNGTAMKCSWGVSDLYSGETFIMDGMLHITHKQGWETSTRHVIIKENCLWEWVEGEKGKKTCLDATENFYDSNILPELQEGRLEDQKYECVPMELTSSKFEVPENIAF